MEHNDCHQPIAHNVDSNGIYLVEEDVFPIDNPFFLRVKDSIRFDSMLSAHPLPKLVSD